jgi:hypothetical protein
MSLAKCYSQDFAQGLSKKDTISTECFSESIMVYAVVSGFQGQKGGWFVSANYNVNLLKTR